MKRIETGSVCLFALVLTGSALAQDGGAPPAATSSTTTLVDERPRMAVLPFSVTALSTNDAERLNAVVRKNIELGGRYVVQDKKTTVELYESAQSLGLDCDAQQTQCAVELGQLSDVDFVLIGTAVGEIDGVGIETILVNVSSAAEKSRVRTRIPVERSAQIPPLRKAVDGLLGNPESLCEARITVEPADAEVWIDGVRDDDGLLEGLAGPAHHLAVRRAGYIAHTQEVQLVSCAAQKLTVVLEVDPDSEVKTGPGLVELTVPWAMVAASAGVVATGAAAATVSLVPLFVYSSATAEMEGISAGDVDGPVRSQAAYEQAQWGRTWWNNAGQYAVWVGAAAVTVGLVVAGAGAAWGTYLLTIDPEQRPEAEE